MMALFMIASDGDFSECRQTIKLHRSNMLRLGISNTHGKRMTNTSMDAIGVDDAHHDAETQI